MSSTTDPESHEKSRQTAGLFSVAFAASSVRLRDLSRTNADLYYMSGAKTRSTERTNSDNG